MFSTQRLYSLCSFKGWSWPPWAIVANAEHVIESHAAGCGACLQSVQSALSPITWRTVEVLQDRGAYKSFSCFKGWSRPVLINFGFHCKNMWVMTLSYNRNFKHFKTLSTPPETETEWFHHQSQHRDPLTNGTKQKAVRPSFPRVLFTVCRWSYSWKASGALA